MDAKKLASLFDNPNFAKWFGKSKVVDVEGNPLSVYHGTRGDFDSFDATKFGQSDAGLVGKGVYVTPEPNVASMFAESFSSGSGNPSVMKGHMRVENPFYFNDGVGEDGTRLQDTFGNAFFTKRLKDGGYDGVIFRHGGEIEQAMALDGRQFKSAFNRGTYDPNDPNILKAALPLAAAGGLMSALSPSDAEARIRAMDAPVEDAWNPVEAFAGGLGGGIKSAAMGVLPDGAMDWALNKFGGLMSGGK